MTLVEKLIAELNVSRPQAEGGLGVLLSLAQKRLEAEDFKQIANLVAGMSDLVGKAPLSAKSEVSTLRATWQRWTSGWGKLTPLRPACEELGLDHATLDRFLAVAGRYFREQGDSEIESLLLSTWR